jgi:predicted Zn-dependent peptidase
MIQREVLDDGLTLLFEPVSGVRSASIGIWLRMGSRHEPPKLSGICHFIEHLVFKGTQNRSARDISLLSDRIGGHLDAFTAKEMTCFYARALDEHLPIAVDLLSDIVRNPLFDEVELEKERGVILEEIRMVSDSPEDRVHDLFSESFWPKHPLGRPIQGTSETISAMSRKTVLNFFRRAYVPSNVIVAVAGRVTKRHREMIRAAFTGVPDGPQVKRGGAPRFRPGLVTESRKQMEQVHLLFGVPALPRGHEDRFSQHMLNMILGGGISSRLFQKIREDRGLVYAVASSLHSYFGGGVLAIYAGTSPAKAREVVKVAVGELQNLAHEGPSEEEWEVARDHVKGSILLGLESTSSRMSRLAREEMTLGRQMSTDEIVRRVEEATPDKVQKLAKKLFAGKSLGLAAVGRTAGMKIKEEDLRI